MKRKTVILAFYVLLAGIPNVMARQSPQRDERPRFRHVYYLFLAGTPVGCEDCYVPLLITAEALETIGKGTTKKSCVLIVTYERDSIWSGDGMVEIAPSEVELPPRILRVRNRRYRFQEISPAEAIRLLANPLGTMPISRPSIPPRVLGPSLQELITDLRQTE